MDRRELFQILLIAPFIRTFAPKTPDLIRGIQSYGTLPGSDDLINHISVISPVDTPLFTMMREASQGTDMRWVTDMLEEIDPNDQP